MSTPERRALASIVIQASWRGLIVRRSHTCVTFDPYDGYQVQHSPRYADADEEGTEHPGYRSFSANAFAAEDAGKPEKAVYRSLSPPPTESAPLVQVGGHGMLVRADEPGVLVKTTTLVEMQVYNEVHGTPLAEHLPAFHGAEVHGQIAALRLGDVTASFASPAVLDIKMGTRTYLENEVSSSKLRVDLAGKLIPLDPNSVSEAERREGITKARYMQARERLSSSATLGWRIEGIGLPSDEFDGDCKRLRTRSELARALRFFLRASSSLQRAFLARLQRLRDDLQDSAWFAQHEVVGSSILFAYDDAADHEDEGSGSVACRMIDFAKTQRIPEGAALTHRDEWRLGNREEGYLTGLDSLLDLWESLGCDD